MHIVHRNVNYWTNKQALKYPNGFAVLGFFFQVSNYFLSLNSHSPLVHRFSLPTFSFPPPLPLSFIFLHFLLPPLLSTPLPFSPFFYCILSSVCLFLLLIHLLFLFILSFSLFLTASSFPFLLSFSFPSSYLLFL